MTNRPDLAELATRARTLADAVDEFRGVIDEAYTAALGEHDPETDEAIVEPSGDQPELYEQATKRAGDARFALTQIIDILATQEGYRHFDDAGVAS